MLHRVRSELVSRSLEICKYNQFSVMSSSTATIRNCASLLEWLAQFRIVSAEAVYFGAYWKNLWKLHSPCVVNFLRISRMCCISDGHFFAGFRDYLLIAMQHRDEKKDLSKNIAAGYLLTFRSCLKSAYQEKLIKENINDYLELTSAQTAHWESLIMEKVRQLPRPV